MMAGFLRSQSRFPIFLASPLTLASFTCSTNTRRKGHAKNAATGKWRCADCPLRLLHYPFLCLLSILCSHFQPSFLSSPLCLGSYSLRQVCVSISYPHCPVSCHPFTRPSSLHHHQGPGGLLRSASGEKGLYLSNAPSNHSS